MPLLKKIDSWYILHSFVFFVVVVVVVVVVVEKLLKSSNEKIKLFFTKFCMPELGPFLCPVHLTNQVEGTVFIRLSAQPRITAHLEQAPTL